MADGLTDKQRVFCEEYIIDFNGTKSAIRAGYEKGSAHSTASEILSYPKVQEYLAELIKARSERTEVTQDRVLVEIARLAFSDIRKAFDDNNNLLSPKDWPDEFAACVSSIKVTEEKKDRNDDSNTVTLVKEVKLWDKGKQIELAGRHLGMFEKDNNQKAPKLIGNIAPSYTPEEWDALLKERRGT